MGVESIINEQDEISSDDEINYDDDFMDQIKHRKMGGKHTHQTNSNNL
jgi:hypothetical protein